MVGLFFFVFFFSSRRRHTRWNCDWSSDVCSSDLPPQARPLPAVPPEDLPAARPPLHDRARPRPRLQGRPTLDRKSTRLNSSHSSISYAVFCLKKKKKNTHDTYTLTDT